VPHAYMCQFEVDSIICSKVIKGSQNFEFWSRDPDDVQLGVDSGRYQGGVSPA